MIKLPMAEAAVGEATAVGDGVRHLEDEGIRTAVDIVMIAQTTATLVVLVTMIQVRIAT